MFSKHGYTQVQEDQPTLHYLQKADDEDYDPGESHPQDWDRIPPGHRPLIEEIRQISLWIFQLDCYLFGRTWILARGSRHVIPTECESPPKAGGRQKYNLTEMKEIQEQIGALRLKGVIQSS